MRQKIIKAKVKKKGLKQATYLKSPAFRLTWAQRLKRVFNIDIEKCSHCGGRVNIIATIKDPLVIKKILDHLEATQDLLPSAYQLPESHGPPVVYRL